MAKSTAADLGATARIRRVEINVVRTVRVRTDAPNTEPDHASHPAHRVRLTTR